ncbi:hypothetical protein [Metarhizobium album]|uniref:hypothetical protein n=1 Tax=Metarhizobium album TaxID=2182425 RepID=UPI001402B891|nr:hypothetical protein [Rhizobium album]
MIRTDTPKTFRVHIDGDRVVTVVAPNSMMAERKVRISHPDCVVRKIKIDRSGANNGG